MGFTLDFQDDQQVIDNLEEVTFASVRTAGDSEETVCDAAFYPGATSEAAPSRGVYTKGLALFTVRAKALEGVGGAKPRDTVTRADGTAYTVLSASKGSVANVWNLDCVNLVLAADLRQTGTLSRPSNAKDDAHRQSLASYTAVASDVPCRVQPEASQAEADALGRRTMPRKYTAYLGQQVAARAKDVFVVGSTRYTVTGVTNPERIDQLMSLSLEEIL